MAEKLNPQSFAALSAAVSPAWHQAILRLAKAAERVDKRFAAWGKSSMIDGGFVRESRNLIKELIDFLDDLDTDPDLEPTLGYMTGAAEVDECEIEEDPEPSFGSLDRAVNQEKSYKQAWASGVDYELDHSDNEPSLGWPERLEQDQSVGSRDDREADNV
jgi:hypothetical protein